MLVVTTCHDCQVFDGGIEEPWKSLMAEQNQQTTSESTDDSGNATPFGNLTPHDVPVDIIVTPTRIIRVSNRLPKPCGVMWDLLSPQKLSQIRVLQELKKRIEDESGETLPSGPDEVLPYHPLPREVGGVEVEGEEADLRAEEEAGEAIEECQVDRRNKTATTKFYLY